MAHNLRNVGDRGHEPCCFRERSDVEVGAGTSGQDPPVLDSDASWNARAVVRFSLMDRVIGGSTEGVWLLGLAPPDGLRGTATAEALEWYIGAVAWVRRRIPVRRASGRSPWPSQVRRAWRGGTRPLFVTRSAPASVSEPDRCSAERPSHAACASHTSCTCARSSALSLRCCRQAPAARATLAGPRPATGRRSGRQTRGWHPRCAGEAWRPRTDSNRRRAP